MTGECGKSSIEPKSAVYFRPGDKVYNWSNGYAQSWATVLCNARKLVDGNYVKGFITAAHLWLDCSSAGDINNMMSTASQATTDYTKDATFVPFNNSSYVGSGKISNSMYSSSNYIQFFVSSYSQSLENYNACIAFGKTSGENTDVDIISINHDYSYTKNGTTYNLTGIKTSYYAQPGDSGGPLVYVNSNNTYTLVGMTSASANDHSYTCVMPVCEIFDALEVEMLGGNN